MNRDNFNKQFFIAVLLLIIFPALSFAWHDETHLAIAKAANYKKWFNATGADMAKIKAGDKEKHNHFANNSPGTIITAKEVIKQAKKYNKRQFRGHLYGAIIASVRDYLKDTNKGKYSEYHLGYCAHYVGDLSQPLHNTLYNFYNRKNHVITDGIVNDEVLDNMSRIEIYPITITSEQELAGEIARIANISLALGYKIESEKRLLTKEEAYIQLGHSVSLLKAILQYARSID
jgi:hypothetical protein